MGQWLLIFVIPFLFLNLIELAMLIHSIELALLDSQCQQQLVLLLLLGLLLVLLFVAALTDYGHVYGAFYCQGANQFSTGWFCLIIVLVLVNPIFGFLVAWMLLYQSSQQSGGMFCGFGSQGGIHSLALDQSLFRRKQRRRRRRSFYKATSSSAANQVDHDGTCHSFISLSCDFVSFAICNWEVFVTLSKMPCFGTKDVPSVPTKVFLTQNYK
jgi:hypothetical protein